MVGVATSDTQLFHVKRRAIRFDELSHARTSFADHLRPFAMAHSVVEEVSLSRSDLE